MPAYKHTMAMPLHLRGLLASDEPHPDSPRRPASDREIIATILARIDAALHAQERSLTCPMHRGVWFVVAPAISPDVRFGHLAFARCLGRLHGGGNPER